MREQYPAFSYDNPEFEATLASVPVDQLKVCDACGKSFLPTGRNAWRMRYCQRKHYIKCKVCGSIADIAPNICIPNTCGKKCNGIFKARQMQATMVKRYGVSNPSQVSEFKEKAKASNAEHQKETMQKIRATMVERYGAAIPRQVPELREKIDKTMVDRYGVVNPSHSLEIRDKISQRNSSEEVQAKYKATSLANHGTEYPAQNPDSPNAWKNIKDKFETTMLDRYGVTTPFVVPECKEKAKQTCLEKYGYEYASQSPEVHTKQWHNRKNLKALDGTPLDSTYEVIVYDFWKALGLDVKRNVPIKFEFEGKTHTTFIDFEVDGLLFEVKGRPYLEGVYDYKQTVPISKKLEVYRDNHIIVIADDTMMYLFGHKDSTESNGLKHLDICPRPLIGVDLKLFTDDPEFPYAENRPKCFYEVSVNGCPSQHTAFYDKRLRWEIIKNRIQYVGGFIDSKEVLVGFNVTRKAKQPSWFSEKYAKQLISKYCTSSIIVDPFAGWGTRHDAAIKLHKAYLGCDSNSELVAWHKLHNRNIVYGDARSFKYDWGCSVFICPPYGNTEIYTSDQVNLSECDWLDIVVANIPNASEYVMVCHKVSDKYKKYIVETKENRSHLNTNTEYVLVIPGTVV